MTVCLSAKLMYNLLIYNSLQGFFSFVFKFKQAFIFLLKKVTNSNTVCYYKNRNKKIYEQYEQQIG